MVIMTRCCICISRVLFSNTLYLRFFPAVGFDIQTQECGEVCGGRAANVWVGCEVRLSEALCSTCRDRQLKLEFILRAPVALLDFPL